MERHYSCSRLNLVGKKGFDDDDLSRSVFISHSTNCYWFNSSNNPSRVVKYAARDLFRFWLQTTCFFVQLIHPSNIFLQWLVFAIISQISLLVLNNNTKVMQAVWLLTVSGCHDDVSNSLFLRSCSCLSSNEIMIPTCSYENKDKKNWRGSCISVW